MKGLWTLPVILDGTSFTDSNVVAQIIFKFIFLGGVMYGCYRLPPKLESVRNGFQTVRYSVYVLIVWYIFTIVDIFFHETSLRAAYGYIMLYFVITLEKLAADILILTGTLRIFSCLLFRRLRTPLPWIHIGEFLIILLVITALYDLGSYFAHQVLWINIADDDIIADVSSRKDKFEAAFFILQWLLTLSMFIAVTYVVLLLKSEPPVSSELFAICASAVLWVRCLSELVIVIHYHLQDNPTSNASAAARDFIYGLCTTCFLLLITPVATDPSCQEIHNVLQQEVEENCRLHVLKLVKEAVDENELPPVLANVFEDMRQDHDFGFLAERTRTELGNDPDQIVTTYISKMEDLYGTLHGQDWSREF